MSRLSRRPELRALAIAGSLAASLCVVPALAKDPLAATQAAPALRDGDLMWAVRPGETLVDIALRELAPPHDWRSLARLNKVGNPLHLAVGQKILIPAPWRKPILIKATVVSVQGPVKAGATTLAPGVTLSENDVIQTGPEAVVVLRLPDGTQIRIPPASQVRIDRLRGYHGSEAINARIQLDGGGVEMQSESSRVGRAPALNREIQVRTPKATASVRGTQFRIGESDERSGAEVLDGSVQWAGREESRMLPAGVGVSVDREGRLGPSEKLLMPPERVTSGTKLEEVEAEVEFQAVPGARRYLVEVARDASFANLLSQTLQEGNKTVVRSEQDGPLFLKVRPLLPSGLAGFDARFSLEVAARPVYPRISASEPAGVNFGQTSALSWNSVPQVSRYRVQVAADAGFAKVVSDEVVSNAQYQFALKAPVTDLTPFHWRVASLDGARQGPWGPVKKLEFGPAMGAAGAQQGKDGLMFEWGGRPGQRFEAQLSRNPGFTDLVASATVEGVSWKVPPLAPGQYQMRVRQIFSNGQPGPYSPVLKLDIPVLLLDGSGQPVGAGSGETVRLQR